MIIEIDIKITILRKIEQNHTHLHNVMESSAAVKQ